MADILEIFLLRTICLPQYQKSSRRFRLRLHKLRSHKFMYPKERDEMMLVMPETSVAGSKYSKAVFLHRFTPMTELDDLLNPALNISVRFQLTMITTHQEEIQQIIRTIGSPDWGSVTMSRLIESYPEAHMCELLSKDCTIEYTNTYSYTFRTKDLSLDLVRIGQFLIPTKSGKPMDVLLSTLHYFIYRLQYNSTEKIPCIAVMVSACLRYFLIDLDTLNKRVCALRYREGPSNVNQLQKLLLQRRIDVMEALIRLVQGPLQILIQHAEPAGHLLEWVSKLESQMSDTCASLREIDTISLDFKKLFDWQLFPLTESSPHWWKFKIENFEEATADEFLARTKSFIDTHYPGAVDPSAIFPESYYKLAHQLREQLSSLNTMIPWSVQTRPGFELIWSVSSLGGISTKSIGDPAKLVPLLPTISSCASSYSIPWRMRKVTSGIEITRNQCMLKGRLSGSTWNYEMHTCKDPGDSKFAHQFTTNKPGVWQTKGSITLPKATNAVQGVPTLWECYVADFSLNRIFLLCANPSELVLIMFDPLSTEKDKNRKTRFMQNDFEAFSGPEFLERLKFFYDELYDPYRSDTFTWIKSNNTLLWAALIVDEPMNNEWNITPYLCLTAISVCQGELKSRQEYIAAGQDQLLYIPPATDEKSEMDLRQNINLSFHFSWRQFGGRTIGLWLRSHGRYLIFEKKATGFVLCCQRQEFPFRHYFMTELIPTTPGLAGTSPILMRRNNTIRLVTDSCSFELFELRVTLK